MGSQPSPATGFRVLSMGLEKPAPATGRYEWDENLCEPRATSKEVGDDHFEGDVRGDEFICTGRLTLTGGDGYRGALTLSGTLYLVGGRIDHGDLTVDSSEPPATFRNVRVDRVNPKRYTAV
jgi:hypothetical protein